MFFFFQIQTCTGSSSTALCLLLLVPHEYVPAQAAVFTHIPFKSAVPEVHRCESVEAFCIGMGCLERDKIHRF